MGWLNCTPAQKDKSRRQEYVEGSPYLELPFLSSYEQNLVSYWVDAGQVTHTANGPVAITWGEIKDWAELFHSEQYVEWVVPPLPARIDGLPDERFRSKPIPLLAKQCTLTDWELQMIKRMSQEYVNEFANTAVDAPCPKEVVIEDLAEEDKLANAKAMKDTLKSMFGVVKTKG